MIQVNLVFKVLRSILDKQSPVSVAHWHSFCYRVDKRRISVQLPRSTGLASAPNCIAPPLGSTQTVSLRVKRPVSDQFPPRNAEVNLYTTWRK